MKTAYNLILALALVVVAAQAYFIHSLAETNDKLVRAIALLLQYINQGTYI